MSNRVTFMCQLDLQQSLSVAATCLVTLITCSVGVSVKADDLWHVITSAWDTSLLVVVPNKAIGHTLSTIIVQEV